MKLLNLILDNFKGIKHYELDPKGSSMDIYGDNATGKTTLADAYFWLLFGKDSGGKSDSGPSGFSVKTDKTSGLDYSVQGTFLGDDDKPFTLQRIYKEKFSRKNGEAEKESGGNTTDFFINGVPKPKKDYTAFVAGLCDERLFMILTDPDMFPGKMKWDERRDTLIRQFAPDVDDREIINAHEELKLLLHYIGMKSVDDYAEITKAERQKINKQLNDIPGRIDEAEKAKPFDNLPTEHDGPELLRLSKTKLQLESTLQKVRNGESAAALRKKVADLQADLSTARAAHIRKSSVGNTALETEASALRSKISQLRSAISTKQTDTSKFEHMADSLESEIVKLREKWSEVAAQEFDQSTGICPTCGREYPPDQLDEMVEQFNQNRATQLENLENKGKELSKTRDDLLVDADEYRQQIAADQQSLKLSEERLTEVTEQFTDPPPFEDTAEYSRLQEQISAAQHDLSTVDSVAAKQVEKLTAQLDDINIHIDAIKARMATKGIIEQQDKRITELKSQEKEYAQMLATYDNGLLLAEKFVQTKAKDIEEKVNGAFRLVRWQLFKKQENGGIKACCEATVKGIEYNTNLNSAAKLNAGLDIINTLGRASGKSVPIWIDNAESVTSFLPIDAQIIRLHVSAKDKQLRSEVRG
ncbi:AAA family ATPase [Caproiciproducens sp.]